MLVIRTESTSAIVISVVSPILASLMVFIDPVASWYLIQLACLAPIVSWMCVSHSCAATLLQCFLLLIGGVGGVLVGWLWLFIQVAFFERAADGHHNHYLGVVLNFVWVALLTLPIVPRDFSRAQALAILCLYTLTIYGGGNANGDNYGNPAKAGLSVVIGCVSTAMVTCLVWFFLSRDQSHQADDTRIKFRNYFSLCIDACQLIGGTLPVQELADSKSKVKSQLCDFLASQPPVLKTHAVVAADSVMALHALLVNSRDCQPFTPEISRSLMNMKLFNDETSTSGFEVEDPRTLAILRCAFLAANKIKRFESAIALHGEKTSLLSEISRFIDSPRIPEVDWRSCIRSTLLLTVLGIFVVAWDDHSEDVEAYAIWALLPALLLMTKFKTVGAMLLHGSRAFLSCLIGCGLGVISASINGNQSMAYLSQLSFLLLVSSVAIFRFNLTGAFFIPICWVICSLAEWNSTADLKDLWLDAIFRNVIVCGSVFITAIGSLFLPVFSSVKLESLDSSTLDLLLKTVHVSWDLEISDQVAIEMRVAATENLGRRTALVSEVCLERVFKKPGNFLDLADLSDAAGTVVALNSLARAMPISAALQTRVHATLGAAREEGLRLEILEFSKSISRSRDGDIVRATALLNFLKIWLTIYEPGNLKRTASKANLL